MTAKTAPKVTLWEFFQQLGKTFMLPVALLSFCGIMLGIGSSLSSHDVITLIPVLGNPVLQAIFTWMSKIGSFAFSFLPVMFCIAIPLGLARENKGVAAFAGFVGYAVMNLAVNFWLTNKGILPTTDAAVLKANNIQSILGIQSIDTGILGAVIAGIIVWMLHERFHNIRLPDALAFFGGTRFVPIISSLVMGLVGLVIPLVWPIFAMGISGLGHMINSAGDFGPMLFGTGERLLLPFGLHHILVALIRFTDAGGTQEVCGQTVSGALTIFQAQLSCPTTHGFSESATRFLSQGKMPAFLGGLPGAALAMYHCARPENRHKIKGLLISGLIACVVGGTTEPLEFLFLFVAPVLYVIHALLTGLGFTVMSVLGVTIGNTDGNIIDFVVFGILHGLSTKWYMVPVVAAIWFVVYYVIFRFAITRFNLKTPGRDSEVASSIEKAVAGAPGKSGYNVPAILEALGGADNIVSLDNCITRLRLSVKDMSLVNVQALKDNQALRFAVVTGCLKIAKESIFTGTNKFVSDTITNSRLNECFGFVQSEVDQLLNDAGLTEQADNIRKWYDGYHFGDFDVYCPWDVMNYMLELQRNPKARPVSYWKNTSDNAIIRSFIEYAGGTITNKLETLMAGGCIVQRVDENLTYDYLHSSEENLWSTLYLTGYLTKARKGDYKDELPDGMAALMIPNAEIKEIFETTVIKWFDDSTKKWNRNALFDAVWNGDSERITKEMNALLRRTISYHDYREDFYHAFLAGIFTGAGYMVDSNKEHGEGRSDVVIYDSMNARVAIFEAKYTKVLENLGSACDTALRQIDDRMYAKEYEEDYDQILCYGISFLKKRCMVKKK